MLKKEMFFHQQTPNGRSLGFSALFVPDGKVNNSNEFTGNGRGFSVNQNGELTVWMSLTICNKKDLHFNKKIARKVLRDRALELVRVKDIPTILQEAWVKSSGQQSYTGQYTNLLHSFV